MVSAFHGCEFVLSCLCLVWPEAKVSLLWPHPRSCLRGFPFADVTSVDVIMMAGPGMSGMVGMSLDMIYAI